MKTIKLTLLFLLLVISTYCQTETFMLGFAGNYPEYNTYGSSQNVNWSWYNDLNLNFWQGFGIGDKHKHILDSLDKYDLYGYFNPDTIIWAAFGRMTIFEAETNSNGRFYFTGFQCGSNYYDNTQYGGGRWVKFFDKNEPCTEMGPSGSVLWSVSENAMQSFGNLDPKYEYPLHDSLDREVNSLGKWYIKPRIRIDSTDAHGTEKNVIKIIVKAYNNNVVLEKTITTSDFLDGNFYYNGSYLEEFINVELMVTADSLNRGRPEPLGNWRYYDINNCHVDYQIYWYGEVSMWVDYIKVMNRPAHEFLGNTQSSIDLRGAIERKAQILFDKDAGINRMKGFYTEEVDYAALNCMEAVNDSLAVWFDGSPKVKIHGLINYETYSFNLRNHNGNEIPEYISAVNPPVYMGIVYPFDGYTPYAPYRGKLPNNVSFYNNGRYTDSIVNYESLAISEMGVSYSEYNTYLQYELQRFADTMFYQYNLARNAGMRFIAEPQVCQWKTGPVDEYQREPMNSELGAQYCISLCRGAEGFMPFEYQSGYSPANVNEAVLPSGKSSASESAGNNWTVFFYGMTDFTHSGGWWGYLKRDHNFYGEPKWNYVKDLYSVVKNKWGPIAANSTNTVGYSVHRDDANHKFLSDLMSIAPNISGTSPCSEDFPNGFIDCEEERYWELGFFEPNYLQTNDQSKYFMLVNRRCIPVAGSNGIDQRYIWLKFNKNQLPGGNTWVLTDIATDQSQSFDVISPATNGYVNFGLDSGSLGWFEPGQAKLFKLEPLPQKGGELIADDTLSGNIFVGDTIISNGYNIVIEGTNSSLTFIDSSCIIMNGGTFQVGNSSEMTGPNDKNIFKAAVSGHKWGGMKFNGTTVKIYNSKFEDISSNQVNYAIKTINCPLVDIRYNIFSSSSDTAGGVQAVYTESESPFSGLYINYNTVYMNNSRGNGICVQGFSGVTLPVYVMNNTMTSNGYAAEGILLTTITGGTVKNNNISGFPTGINLMNSVIDLYGNVISNTASESRGILGSSSSTLGMLLAGTGGWLGGYNVITNTSGSSINIQVDNSLFFTDGGRNKFDVTTSASPTAYHMFGSFQSGSYSTRHRDNCFKLDGTAITSPALPYNYLADGMSQVTLSFLSYDCSTTPPAEEDIVDIGNGLYDTIPSSGGQGGGMSSVTSETPKQL
jgi:hypothetical protein